LLVFLAMRGLLQRKLDLVILVGAVAAGVSFQIPNTGNLAGYEAELIAQGVSSGAGDVRLRPREGARFVDGDGLARKVAAYPEVHDAIPLLFLPGAIGAKGRWLSAPVLGVDDASPRKPYRPPEGHTLGVDDGGRMLLGSSLASRLRVGVGERVELRVILDTAPGRGDRAVGLGVFSMEVAGIMRGVFTADEVVVVDRSFLGRAAQEPGAASMVLVYSDRPGEARALASRLAADLPEVEALAWLDDSPFLGSAVKGNRVLNGISSAMAMVGVAIPVWAVLYLRVTQRRREIGLLAALGFAQRELFLIFLLEALMVGLLGVALGALGGWALVRWFVAHPIYQAAGFTIRPLLSVAALLRATGVILSTTLVAGAYPAFRAARTDPARELRGLG
jgi:ABC-type lipoprotein release transport system permease subunit